MTRSMIRAARNAAALAVIALAIAMATPVRSAAKGLGVEVWTDRGSDAVYQAGDVLQVRARATADVYLLVYEIDSDGYVHVLYPTRGLTGLVSARETYKVPDETSDEQLVVQDATGQDFIVAIASREPFDNLPWYLRPLDIQGDDMGYVNAPKTDDEGVTSDGRIVGDPFVAMERIRRRALARPTDENSFATAYTAYYVHEAVRYPRYICNDCHRPDQWAWWDGWDPYYTHCSVVDFRINWSWNWGPTYWTGFVPYYVYVPRTDCPPRYRWNDNVWYSSWDGYARWTRTWNGPLTRYKSPPPPGYVPPTLWQNWKRGDAPPPPGFVSVGARRERGDVVVGRDRPTDGARAPRVYDGGRDRPRPGPNSPPSDNEANGGARQPREGQTREGQSVGETRHPGVERMPARSPSDGGTQRPAEHRETPHQPPPPHQSPPPRNERPRQQGQAPKSEKPSQGGHTKQPAPAETHERHERGG